MKPALRCGETEEHGVLVAVSTSVAGFKMSVPWIAVRCVGLTDDSGFPSEAHIGLGVGHSELRIIRNGCDTDHGVPTTFPIMLLRLLFGLTAQCLGNLNMLDLRYL